MDKEIVSLTGKVWLVKIPETTYRGYSDVLSRLLINRCIPESEVEDFINPTLKNLMPDPYLLKDMERSVQKIAKCINDNERIVIIGDYDVDGVTSTALLINYFRAIGFRNFDYYIPHRVEDGYGINEHIINRFSDVKNIITADNGSTAKAALKSAKEKGIDVVVLDHHEIPYIDENAFSIVNAHRDDDHSNLECLCAAGIVYFFIIALNRYFRLTNFFKIHNITEPKLIDYIDVVALGTVCDVMPLVGLNRAIVKHGLHRALLSKNCGLKTLIKNMKFEKKATAELFGFFIGPRLNAAGRIDSAEISVELLTSESKEQANELSNKLDKLNSERQAIENITLDNIPPLLPDEKFAFAYGNNWHIGIIGIVAGKLKEKYNVPSFVISFDDNGIGHGSARSVEKYDLAEIINEAKEKGILAGGGGHKLAGGFSLKKSQLPDFKNFLETKITGDRVPVKLVADGYVALSGINMDLINEIERLEPFGAENEKPHFIIPNVKIAYSNTVGKNGKHISVVFEDEFGYRLKGIAFNSVDTSLGAILLDVKSKGKLFNILGSLSTNEWNGKTSIDIIIDDISARSL